MRAKVLSREGIARTIARFATIAQVPSMITTGSSGRRDISAVWLSRSLLLGLIDASVIVAYLAGISTEFWHGVALMAKFCLLLLYRAPRSTYLIQATPILGLALLLVVLSVFGGVTEWGILVRTLGFFAHLFLTFILLERCTLSAYARGVTWMVVGGAAVHILGAATGQIDSLYGRFFYLGNSHPNLGGEINALGGVMGVLALRRRPALICLTVLVTSTLLVQARASLLVLLVLIGIVLIFDNQRRLVPVRLAIAALVILVVTVALVTFFPSQLMQAIDGVFLVSDEYRGADSNLVGRFDRWGPALLLIARHPLTGVGAGYFETHQLLSPHNFVLSALVELGVLAGGLLLIFVAVCVFRAWRVSIFTGSALSSLLILIMFNDRFFNLNPYPFIFFVLLIATGAPTPWLKQARRLDRRPTQAQTQRPRLVAQKPKWRSPGH